MQLYDWLSSVASNQSSGKALVYRDTYLSWRGLSIASIGACRSARAGDREGSLGRAHARQRPRLRHPGAGAVQGRRDGGPARSDAPARASSGSSWTPRRCARSSPARAAAKGARQPPGSPTGAGRRPASARRPPSESPRVAPAAAGHAAHLRALQAHDAHQLTSGSANRMLYSSPPTSAATRRASSSRGEPRRLGRGHPQDPGGHRRRSHPLHGAAARQLRLRLRHAALPGQRRDAVPRGRGVAQAHRQAAARAANRVLRRNARAVRRLARSRRRSRSRTPARGT